MFQPSLWAARLLEADQHTQTCQHFFKLVLGPFSLESSLKLCQSVKQDSTILYFRETALDSPGTYELLIRLDRRRTHTQLQVSLNLDLSHWLPLSSSEQLRHSLVQGLLSQHAQSLLAHLNRFPIPQPLQPRCVVERADQSVRVTRLESEEDIIAGLVALLPRECF